MGKGNCKTKEVIISGIIFFVIPWLLFTGCAGKVSWVNIEPKSLELNKPGETFQLKAAALDKKNQPLPEAKIIWTSSNPEVATVDAQGLLTAKGSGNSVITAMAENGEKAVTQCKVAILDKIKIEPENAVLKVGEKLEMKATALNEKGAPFEDQNVGWASSDDDIVFIDDLGNITAVAPGEVNITATIPTKDLSHKYGSAKVTVSAAE